MREVTDLADRLSYMVDKEAEPVDLDQVLARLLLKYVQQCNETDNRVRGVNDIKRYIEKVGL